jgi:peroxiredoxin
MVRAFFAATLSSLAIMAASASDADRVKDFVLSDVHGRSHGRLEWKGKKALVVLFLGIECPVSNSYAPEMARLAKEYTPRGVLFWGLHPDPDVSAKMAADHAAEYGLLFLILLDPAQDFARQVGVRVVPEAVVLSPQGQVHYRGRIDDRYTSNGKRREEPTTHDLASALDAVLAGKPPPAAQVPGFGCPLSPVQH